VVWGGGGRLRRVASDAEHSGQVVRQGSEKRRAIFRDRKKLHERKRIRIRKRKNKLTLHK